MRKTSFEHWFKTAQLVTIDQDGTALIECGAEKGATWMEENYHKLMLDIMGKLREGVGKIRFVQR